LSYVVQFNVYVSLLLTSEGLFVSKANKLVHPLKASPFIFVHLVISMHVNGEFLKAYESTVAKLGFKSDKLVILVFLKALGFITVTSSNPVTIYKFTQSQKIFSGIVSNFSPATTSEPK